MGKPKITPVSHREFCRRMVKLGFDGPCHGGKHQYFVRDGQRFTTPNPHSGDIRPALLWRLLKQYGITIEKWNSVA